MQYRKASHPFAWVLILLSCAGMSGCNRNVGFFRVEAPFQETTLATRQAVGGFSQTLLPTSVANQENGATYGGECASGSVVTVVLQGQGRLRQIKCNDGVWSFTVVGTTDAKREYIFTQSGSGVTTATIAADWTRDTAPPTFTVPNPILNDGVPSSVSNYIALGTRATDEMSHITHFCARYTRNAAQVPPPVENCWVPVDHPDQPRLTPGRGLSLSGFIFRLGFTAGTYYVFVYVKDRAGNLSAAQSGSILFTPNPAPVVVNTFAANANTASAPPSAAETTVPAGQPVYVKWHASSAGGLIASPITVSYTLDDVIYTTVTRGLSNAAHSGCTIDTTLYSGCYSFASPSSAYFRVRVAAADGNGMITFGPSNLVNSGSLRSLAGNTEPGHGGSGTAALYFNADKGPINPDLGSFAVTRDGTIFFRDVRRGLLRVRPIDGIQQLLIPLGTASTGDGESVLSSTGATQAQLRMPYKIALDYSDGLLIFDHDRIRRLNTTTLVIDTIVGGGNSNADNISPLDVRITPPSPTMGERAALTTTFVPLPNGDLVFQSDRYYGARQRARVLNASTTGLVTSLNPSGIGHATSATEDINTCTSLVAGTPSSCYLQNLSLAFDPTTSLFTFLLTHVVHPISGNILAPIAALQPQGSAQGTTIAAGAHPTNPDAYAYTFTGRDGEIYVVLKRISLAYKYNRTTNVFDLILGNGSVGTCVDGTQALSCASDLYDLFVDSQGNVFFVDRGTVRTIDADGRVVTLNGQRTSFGDLGLATSARFKEINVIRQSDNQRVQILDQQEFRIREFTIDGTIQTLAGNGTNGVPNLTAAANVQSIQTTSSGNYWDYFDVNSTNGDLYMHRGSTVAKLSRASGKWEQITAGLAGFYYPPLVLGNDGTNLLFGSIRFEYGLNLLQDSALIKVPIAGGTPRLYAGVAGNVDTSFCTPGPSGTSLTACAVPSAHARVQLPVVFDANTGHWITSRVGDTNIYALTASEIETKVVSLSQPVKSFTFKHNATTTQDEIYYCGANGRVYHRVVGTASDVALPWLVATLSCSGMSMLYNSTRNSLIFPYKQNQIQGIAEYVLP